MGRQSVARWLRANALLGLLLCPLVSPAHAALTEFTLQVTREAASGTTPPLGSVTSAPVTSGPARIDCGATCAVQFLSGTRVVLTAADSAPWIFVRWGAGGACDGSTSRTCVVEMTSDRTARAVFAFIEPTPLVLQSYLLNCGLAIYLANINCDHTPTPGVGFGVVHKELRGDFFPDGSSHIIIDGQVNAQGAPAGQASIRGTFDGFGSSQYSSVGSTDFQSESTKTVLVASDTLPSGTPVTVRVTYQVKLQYTLDVTYNENVQQWSVTWPTLSVVLSTGSGTQYLVLERPPANYPPVGYVGSPASFKQTLDKTVDLIAQSTVGATIPLVVRIVGSVGKIETVRTHVHGDYSAQVNGPYLTVSPAGVVAEQFAIRSLLYPYPDVWTQDYPVFDGNPLKLEAQVRNYSSTAMTAVVDFARSDYLPITGAIPSTSVTVVVPANGTSVAAIRIPSDGLSRDAQGSTRLTPLGFTASVLGVGKASDVLVKPRPIFLFNGIWSDTTTWESVVLDALARPDGAFLTVVPVPGLLTSQLLPAAPGVPPVPYQDIATNVNIAHDFIQARRANGNFWKYYLVGHSLGGLMIRHYLQLYNEPFAPFYKRPLVGTPVERIFTIGTPYLGSRCADAFNFLVGRKDVRELTTYFLEDFNKRNLFAVNTTSSLAAFSTPIPLVPTLLPPTCGEFSPSDGVVSRASATINESILSRHLTDLLNLNPFHIFQTGAVGMFNLGIAPNTIGPPTPPAQATAKPMAQVAATSATVSSEWNTGSGTAALPVVGGCAVSESVRVPSGNVTLSLLSDGAGTATITSPAGVASETPVAPLFSGAIFTPSQAGAWSLQLCSTSGGASFAQWSAMVTDTPYRHEISDVLFSGGNQLIPVRVGVAAGSPLPISASYVLSSLSQKHSGSLPLSELLQNGATISIDSSLFAGEESLQLEIALILPDGVVLRTISTVANDAIFASSFE